jgi:DNA-binding protein HU-beta
VNKAELIEHMSSNGLGTKVAAEAALKATIEGIQAGLKKKGSNEVRLIGFGTFRVAKRKARMGRNPKTGEEIKIKASKTVTFKPGKGLKESV